jgi:hypothetical protein
MLVTMRELQLEQARLDATLLDQLRAQQQEHGGEVAAVLVSPMVDVGGTFVRARPTLFVAPGLLASMPVHPSSAAGGSALERLTRIEVRESAALPFVVPPGDGEA